MVSRVEWRDEEEEVGKVSSVTSLPISSTEFIVGIIILTVSTV